VRRLALEGLTSANALDEEIVAIAATDPDAQVRRLAMRAAAISGAGMANVVSGLLDPVPLVRLESLRALRSRSAEPMCEASLKASADSDMEVALVAIDQLDACGHSPEAVAALERAVADRSELETARGWHRSAHALLALSVASPDRAAGALLPYMHSTIWQVRSYAARAAISLNDRTALQALADDQDERVASVALAGLGAPPRPRAARHELELAPPTAADLKRLSAARATITIRDAGRFEVALLTAEAPATVMRFAQLAESGYYNGLTFDRIAPNAIVQGGRRTGDDARYPQSEIGTWPHVRGVVGLAMPDTNDAQFFVDLVDNPRFDHQYPVFAQVLNGADVVEQILEGDVIESITIVP
jgi:peptidyl-prolyl cis-trans isomerase B (cyclophilin B)